MKGIDGASVLVTGGTGSFGRKFCEELLKNHKPRRVIVLSRDELKQHNMRCEGFDAPCMRYFIGDIRDRDRLYRAFADVDIVVHAAAMKHVSACEYNPLEAVQTNIHGARNIIEAAIDTGVKKVISLSTDKAVNPVNLYGATKLVAEKILTQGNSYAGAAVTRFSCVRYGNVVGSSGSVIPLFQQQKETGTLTLTDERMTRFWITLEQGVDLVLRCLDRMRGGEIFVPKIPSMKVVDLAEAIAPECKRTFVGIRPGERVHEVLVSEDEARHAVEEKDMYTIYPEEPWWTDEEWPKSNLPEWFRYTSDKNDQWLTMEQMRELISA